MAEPVTEKTTPTEEEIERRRGKQAREFIENLLRQEGYAYEVLIAAAEHYEPDLLALLATVRAEGAIEEQKAWGKEAERWDSEVAEFGKPMDPDHNHHVIRDWLNDAFAAGKAVGAREEREAMVSWLRGSTYSHVGLPREQIERGDHLKGDQ